MCDYDLKIPQWYGVEDLQDALNLFKEINTFTWFAFSRFKWFKPEYSLGIKALDRALQKIEATNRHHIIYYPDSKSIVPIEREAWIEALNDLGISYIE